MRARISDSLTPTAYDIAREPTLVRLASAIVMLCVSIALFFWLLAEALLRLIVAPSRPALPPPNDPGLLA